MKNFKQRLKEKQEFEEHVWSIFGKHKNEFGCFEFAVEYGIEEDSVVFYNSGGFPIYKIPFSFFEDYDAAVRAKTP